MIANLSSSVLRALREAEYGSDYVIIREPLNAQDYKQANLILEKAGGIWTKAQKRHIFAKGDPRVLVTALYEEGNLSIFTVVGLLTNGERFCASYAAKDELAAQAQAHQYVNAGKLVDPNRMLLVAGVFEGSHANVAANHILATH